MALQLRAGRPDDAQTCGRICFEAFKSISEHHRFPWDFPDADTAIGLLTDLLNRDDVYSVVAEEDGRIVGSNFLWEQTVIAGVGPITVDPAGQNGKVGRQLMVDVMRRAAERKFAGVRLLQAAYHNRSLSLYTKLGFDAREPISVMQGDPLGLSVPGCPVQAATLADVEACNDLCRRTHGHDRDLELRQAIALGTATVVHRHNRVTAYATMIGFFGHAVAESNEDMQALIGAAPAFPGPGFLLPTRNSGLLRWCLQHGLRIVMPMTLMSVGLYNEPSNPFMPTVIF